MTAPDARLPVKIKAQTLYLKAQNAAFGADLSLQIRGETRHIIHKNVGS